MTGCLAAIAPKLAKLLPLLSSDKPGEVVATAAAIGRTLSGAGLDWHDLARRIEACSVARDSAGTYRPAYRPPARPQPRPPKPQAEPTPWPTWPTLRRSGRLAWLKVISDSPFKMEKSKRTAFDELHEKVVRRPHEWLTREEFDLFNQIVQVNWSLGVRP